MKFQNPSMQYARNHGQPQSNMTPQLLRSWGHNKIIYGRFTYPYVRDADYVPADVDFALILRCHN